MRSRSRDAAAASALRSARRRRRERAHRRARLESILKAGRWSAVEEQAKDFTMLQASAPAPGHVRPSRDYTPA